MVLCSAIPTPVYTNDVEICLITKDPQREYKDLVAKKNIKAVTKVCQSHAVISLFDTG